MPGMLSDNNAAPLLVRGTYTLLVPIVIDLTFDRPVHFEDGAIENPAAFHCWIENQYYQATFVEVNDDTTITIQLDSLQFDTHLDQVEFNTDPDQLAITSYDGGVAAPPVPPWPITELA